MHYPAVDSGRFPLPYLTPKYTTPENIAKKFSSLFPSLGFYPRLLNIVVRGGSLAKQGRYDGTEWNKSSLNTIRALEYCGVKFEISGLEHVMNLKRPGIFVANHMSTLETFVLPCLIQTHQKVTFVIKDTLLRYPYFGPLLGALNPVVVTRKDAREDLRAMLDGGAKRIADGHSIIIFPQGTRNLVFKPREFNSIGVKLARKAGAPVVPVALRSDAWGNGRFLKDFGVVRPQLPVHFKFGKPLDIKDAGKEEHAAILEFIATNLKIWGVEVQTDAR
jgi:1-acyl-sn-glycerol-3-phosphate acyltransferase